MLFRQFAQHAVEIARIDEPDMAVAIGGLLIRTRKRPAIHEDPAVRTGMLEFANQRRDRILRPMQAVPVAALEQQHLAVAFQHPGRIIGTGTGIARRTLGPPARSR